MKKLARPMRLVIAALVVTLALPGAALAAQERGFTDWRSPGQPDFGVGTMHWLAIYLDDYRAVRDAIRWELYHGYPDNTLRLFETQITRAEFATALCRALGHDPDPARGGAWWEPYTAWLGERGILDPKSGDWNAPIPRWEMAAWCGRAVRAFEGDPQGPSLEFADLKMPSDIQEDILTAAKAGVVVGETDYRGVRLFRPFAPSERVHAALVLGRLVRALKKNAPAAERLCEIIAALDAKQIEIEKAWDGKANADGYLCPDYTPLREWGTERYIRRVLVPEFAFRYGAYGRVLIPVELKSEVVSAECYSTVAKVVRRVHYQTVGQDGKPAFPGWEGFTVVLEHYFVLRDGKWLRTDDAQPEALSGGSGK